MNLLGIIDQTSIPESNIFVLFPHLFKNKNPKNLPGFQDFIEKIDEMGLSHLIRISSKASKAFAKSSNTSTDLPSSTNWWFLD